MTHYQKNNIMRIQKQQGVIMIVTLILLLIITIISIAAAKMATTKTQVAGNSIYTMLTYQGAESALTKTLRGGAEINLRNAAQLGINTPYKLGNSYFSATPDTINNGVIMPQSAVVKSLGLSSTCPVSSLANSMGGCYIFSISAQARIDSTNARAMHSMAVATPKLGK